jgi:hypothetical protein
VADPGFLAQPPNKKTKWENIIIKMAFKGSTVVFMDKKNA